MAGALEVSSQEKCSRGKRAPQKRCWKRRSQGVSVARGVADRKIVASKIMLFDMARPECRPSTPPTRHADMGGPHNLMSPASPAEAATGGKQKERAWWW